MIGIIVLAFRIFEMAILARVLISWINADPYHPVVMWIYRITEPILAPIRQMLPTGRIGIDLSPLVVLIIIQFLERLIIQSIY